MNQNCEKCKKTYNPEEMGQCPHCLHLGNEPKKSWIYKNAGKLLIITLILNALTYPIFAPLSASPYPGQRPLTAIISMILGVIVLISPSFITRSIRKRPLCTPAAIIAITVLGFVLCVILTVILHHFTKLTPTDTVSSIILTPIIGILAMMLAFRRSWEQ